MTLTEIIDIILTLVLPVMIGIAYWLFHFLIQRMPQQQRTALEQFAYIAVRSVEQQSAASEQKKTLAIGIVASLFKAFKLPVPPQAAISIVVDAAVFDLNKPSA